MSKAEKIFYWFCLGLVIYITIGFKLIPTIIEKQTIENLDKNLTLKSHIDKVEFNPFNFTAKIHGLKLGDYDKPTVALDELILDLGVAESLFEFHINIEEIRLSKLYLNVIQEKDDSINLAKILKPSDNVEVEKNDTKSNDIKFLISKFYLENSKINFTKIKENDSFILNLDNINYFLHDVGTFKNSLAASDLSFFINNKSKVSVQGAFNIMPFKMYGKTKISQLMLNDIISYKKELLNFSLDEKASFDLDLNYDIDAKKDFDFKLDSEKILFSNINISQDKNEIFKLNSLDISALNLDLLKQKLIIDGVNLNNPHINVVQSKDGINLSTLVINNKETNTTNDNESSEKEKSNWLIDVNNIAVNNSNLVFNDTLNNTLIKNNNFTLKTSNVNVVDSQINITNVDLLNPQIKIIDNKNKVNLNANNLDINLDKINLSNNIAINKINVKKDSVSLINKKSSMYINTYKTNVILNKLNLENGNISISDINSKVSKINLKNKKDKLAININNTNLYLNKLLIKDKIINIANLNVKRPSININNTEDKTNIKASNIDLNISDITSYSSGLLKVAKTTLNKPKIEIILPKKNSKETSTNVVEKTNNQYNKEESKLDIGPVNIQNATLIFEDKNLPLPFKTTISNLNGKISELVTTKASKTRLEVNGIVDKYGTTKITGIVNPNNIKILTDINMLFKNISVKNFTPYSGKFVGREIDSGKLNLDLNYNIQKSDLDAQNSIVITKLELGKNVESKDAVSLPLELAIALLEDSNGVIDLNIPVSGNIDDPKFSVAPIVWKAFTNLILKAVTAPFSLLGALFGFDENEIKSVNFDFAQSDITPIQKETLDKISQILTKRPNLALKLVPSYDEQKDLIALKKLSFDNFVKSKIPNDQIRDYENKYLSVLENKYKTFDKKLTAKNKFIKDKKLNNTEYIKFLETTLLNKQEVTKLDLENMAKKRVSNIKEYLTSTKKIKESQIKIVEDVKVKIQSSKTSNIDLEIDKAK